MLLLANGIASRLKKVFKFDLKIILVLGIYPSCNLNSNLKIRFNMKQGIENCVKISMDIMFQVSIQFAD